HRRQARASAGRHCACARARHWCDAQICEESDVRLCACGPLADAHVAPRVDSRAPHVDARGKRRPDR
ncbi:hypothetical protein ACX84U_32690, partial [Burkholderia pseudomallei]